MSQHFSKDTPSWKDAMVADTTEQFNNILADGGRISNDLKHQALAKLNERLSTTKEFEKFECRAYISAELKNNYVQVDRIHARDLPGVYSMHVGPDISVAAGYAKGEICVWKQDANKKWQRENVTTLADHIVYVEAFPDGSIVAGARQGTISICQRSISGKWEVDIFKAHDNGTTSIHRLPGNRLISGGKDGLVKAWERIDGSWASVTIANHMHEIRSVDLTSHNCVISSSNDIIKVTRMFEREWEYLLGIQVENLHCLHVVEDGKFYTGSGSGADKLIFHWRKGLGKWDQKEFEVPGRQVQNLQCLQGNRAMVFDPFKCTVRILELDGFRYKELSSFDTRVTLTGLQIIPDGRIFASDRNGHINIWDGEKA